MINFILFVLLIVGMAKVFMKAGRQWWEAIIPVYNTYVLLKITKTSVWWLVAFLGLFLEIAVWGLASFFNIGQGLVGTLLPVAILAGIISAIVLGLVVPSRLSRVFGHGIGMSLGLILLPFIFYPILGFDKSIYQESPTLG